MEDSLEQRLKEALDAIERVRALCDEAEALANRPPWNRISGHGNYDYGKFERTEPGSGSAPYDTNSGCIYTIRPEAILAALEGKSDG